MKHQLNISPATRDDCALILEFIRELAAYERLSHEVVATEQALRDTLFGSRAYAEVLIARWRGQPAGFALFFHNYSTFLARPGIYLEDLYVRTEYRGNGIGKNLLAALAELVVARDGGRLDWSVLDWNEPSIKFYQGLGARPLDEWTQFRLDGDALQSMANSAIQTFEET